MRPRRLRATLRQPPDPVLPGALASIATKHRRGTLRLAGAERADLAKAQRSGEQRRVPLEVDRREYDRAYIRTGDHAAVAAHQDDRQRAECRDQIVALRGIAHEQIRVAE